MRFFKSNVGMVKPFKITLNDGITAKDLTALTVEWHFKDRDGNAPTGSPIVGNITNPTGGLVEFTIPAGITAVAGTKFKCQINLDSGAGYDEDTEPFNVDIDKSAKP